MSFFEQFPAPPPPPEPEAQPRWPWEQPVYALPASVPGDTVLVRGERAAVWIGGIQVYPNGFVFHLRAVLRHTPPMGGPLGDPMSGRHNPLAPAGPDERLRIGLRYADGRRVSARGGLPDPWPDDDDEQAIRLITRGGASSSLTWDTSFWTHPLPPDGPVTVFASWLDAGVREVSVDLDGTAIREAGCRAQRLWPQDEDPEDEGGTSFGVMSVATAETAPPSPRAEAASAPEDDADRTD
jgi:hypothetical protein